MICNLIRQLDLCFKGRRTFFLHFYILKKERVSGDFIRGLLRTNGFAKIKKFEIKTSAAKFKMVEVSRE